MTKTEIDSLRYLRKTYKALLKRYEFEPGRKDVLKKWISEIEERLEWHKTTRSKRLNF